MKKMKYISMLVVVILFTTIAFGQKQQQGKRPTKEKVKALKIAHITSKLNLTTEEAQKFWPIYNEFEAKMSEFRKKRKEKHKKGEAKPKMTDAELEKMMNNHFDVEQKQLNLKKEYHTKFKAVLPIQKVAKLYKAEHSFKRELLKKMRVKKGGPNELNIPPPPHQH